MPVKVYTRSTCAPCRMVKTWLQKKGIKYEELSLDERPELADEVLLKSGALMVPFIQVGEESVVGANLPLLSKLLMV